MSWPRTVLVTGAGSGLGLALASAFARGGASVLGLVRRPPSVEELRESTSGRAVAVLADVTDPAVEVAIEASVDGPLDLLVNNAGAMASGSRLVDLDPGEILRLVDLHCLGALRCTRAALPALRRSERALVINVSSRLGSIARVASGEFDALAISYAMRISKAALNMATACLARELAADGIGVHSVHPGRIRTRMASTDADLSPKEAADRLLSWLDRLSTTETCGYWNDQGRPIPW